MKVRRETCKNCGTLEHTFMACDVCGVEVPHDDPLGFPKGWMAIEVQRYRGEKDPIEGLPMNERIRAPWFVCSYQCLEAFKIPEGGYVKREEALDEG